SSTQQGMLFHHLYARHSGVDIEQMVCRLPEKLNVPAFQRAWESVVARHPALRASFHWEGLDEPVQKVHHDPPLPFEVQDWQACSAAAQESQLEAYLQADRRRGFDLTEAPLMRFMLF